MAKLAASVKNMHFAEKTLLGLILVSLVVRYVFYFQGSAFMELFSVSAALMYCPLGFYFIGKPSPDYSYKPAVVLGFVYALGIVSILLSALNIDSYRYPLIGDCFVLLAIVIHLLLKIRSGVRYASIFVITQFIRVGFIIMCGMIILIK